MKNELFVTVGEVVQELGVSKPFAYKLVRQMDEKLEEKVLSLSLDVSAPNTMKENFMAFFIYTLENGKVEEHEL